MLGVLRISRNSGQISHKYDLNQLLELSRRIETKYLTILHACISMTTILVNLNGGLL